MLNGTASDQPSNFCNCCVPQCVVPSNNNQSTNRPTNRHAINQMPMPTLFAISNNQALQNNQSINNFSLPFFPSKQASHANNPKLSNLDTFTPPPSTHIFVLFPRPYTHIARCQFPPFHSSVCDSIAILRLHSVFSAFFVPMPYANYHTHRSRQTYDSGGIGWWWWFIAMQPWALAFHRNEWI